MFTVEEITLMKMYVGLTVDKNVLIENLEKVVPHFTEDEHEMKELTQGVIRKLTAMNRIAFEKINFDLAMDEEDNLNEFVE